jgi:hypothetical protein
MLHQSNVASVQGAHCRYERHAFAKKTNLDIDPTMGQDLAKIFRGIFATSPEALEFARKLYN